MRRWSISLLLAAVLVAATAATASAQLKRIPAEITPLVESDGVRAGTTVRAALQVTLPEGFHVQSNKPRDPSLIATELAVEGAFGYPGATSSSSRRRSTSRRKACTEPLLVFDREFTIGVRLAVPADLPPGEVTVPARLRYQACDDKVCFAPSNGAGVVDADGRAGRERRVTAQHGDAARRDCVRHRRDAAAAAAAAPAARPRRRAGGRRTAAWRSSSRFTVVATTGGYLGTGDFLTFIKNAEAGVTEQGLFEGRGPLAILLIVFLGGLALNLTPCVLPMIPINLAIIGAGAQAGSRRRGFLLGLVYGGAMAFVYGVLGLIVDATASTFGTINASPWFNLGIAVLFVALALAMFDVFEIDFSRFSGNVGTGASRGTFDAGLHDGRRGGAAGRRVRGAGGDPGRAVREQSLRDRHVGGAGAAVLPGHRHGGAVADSPAPASASLPKPGPWMVRVKQGFGVLILRHRGLLRLPRLRHLPRSLGRRRRGVVERGRTAEGRLARRRSPKAWPSPSAKASPC